jgi:hypothetical protein
MEARMSRSVVVVVCASLFGAGAACGADPAAAVLDTSGAPAESSSGTPVESSSSSSTGTTGVGESSSGTPSGTTGTSSSDEGEATHQPYFDVGEQGDLPPDDSTTGGIIIDWDCDELVQPFESEAELVGPRGYHDVYFNEDGQIIGSDGSSLVASTYDGEVSVFLPGVNSVQGMDVLENWDLLFVNDYGELRRVTPELVQTTVTGSVSQAYGITVGPDQMAYVSTGNGILRVDPETGETVTWLATNEHPRAMVFNLDSSGVYFSTLGGGNNSVFYQAVDNALNPDEDEPLVQFADNVGQGYHDGLGIDACGNLYVPDYNTRGLYRVDPEAAVTMLFSENNASPSHYGHGLEWGSGIDGWNDKAIYLPQPYDGNTVLEVVLGVPSGSLVRTWD